MGAKMGVRLIEIKTEGDTQLSHDCESATIIIANNADYTPARMALAA